MSTRQAADAIATAYRKADASVYAARQRAEKMLPRQGEAEVRKARAAARESIREARADLDHAIAAERRESRRRLDVDPNKAAKINVYTTRGMALANAGMDDLEAAIRDELAAGNQTAAREYLLAGGSRLRDHMARGLDGSGSTDYRTLQRAAASNSDAKRAGHAKALDHLENSTGWLDGYMRKLDDRIGVGDTDTDPETQREDLGAVIARWAETAHSEAIEAGDREVDAYTDAARNAGVE